MEKAKLVLAISKKKKVTAKLQFENGKKMPLAQHNLRDTTLNGSEVDVERQNGRVVLVKTKDKVIYDVNLQSSNQIKSRHQQERYSKQRPVKAPPINNEWQDKHVSHIRDPAHAPYNFVPLNNEIIEGEPPPLANKYDAERNTGWIEVEIEALTPLYIRGTLTEKDVKEGKQSNEKSDFCAPAGKIRIPGSSLRGMVRSMVEMTSFGKFHFFDNKRLYYRGLADMSNLRSEYQSHMSSFDSRARRTTYKMNAGYLVKDNLKYKIIPAKGKQFDRISKTEIERYLKDPTIKVFEIDKKTYKFFKLQENYVVISGDMPNKKHDWIINPPNNNAETVELNNDDVIDYYSDKKRDAVNLIKVLEHDRNPELKLPCFYVEWMIDKKQERVSFGHTAMFRLAYEKKIGEHIEQLINNGKIDFAEAIFGNEQTFAGRVFFEDAFLTDSQIKQTEEQTPQILSTPEPTTFQHYLVQNSDEVRQLNHYNSEAVIRGHKFYWHKSGNNWTEPDKKAIEEHRTQYTRIRPVKQGTRFKGIIRFENLSNIELGALIFALDLPEGCAHKLGMGKPLGLGSVNINPKVYISNRDKRYRDFFAECWENKIEPLDCDNLGRIKEGFEKYILSNLGKDSTELLWDTERLRELLVMLHVGTGKNLEKTGANDYMKIEPRNEFKNRYVLPQASRIPPALPVENILATLSGKPKPEDDREKITHIKKIEIIGLWDKFNIDWSVDEKVSILVGINGSGKSTILRFIDYALTGKYENHEEYPAQKLTLTFDNDEKLSYQRTGLGIKRTGTPPPHFIPEFVSTFDAPLILKGTGEDKEETTNVQVEKQLATKLWERIDCFFLEVDKLLQLKIEPKPYIDDFVQLVNDDLFYRTNKSIEFVGEIKFTETWAKHLLADKDVPDALHEKIKAMISKETYKLDETFPDFLESKIGKINTSLLRSKILQYVEFVHDSVRSHAIFPLDDGRRLMPDQLSTGEKQILIILFTALILKFRSLVNPDLRHVLIIDEPENSLHLKWQKFLISYIRRLNESLQIIIATHAPAIIKKGYMKKTVEINHIKSGMGA